jgi:hypothetical protein
MKKISIAIGLIPFMFFSSCDSAVKEADMTEGKASIEIFEEIDNKLSELYDGTQFYTIPADKESIVKGTGGTRLFVNPSDLENEGGYPITGSLTVELRELNSLGNLVLNNAPTTSNGNILITGGAYYIDITSDGSKVKLKEGKTMKAEFPKSLEANMSIFQGELDKNNQVNWIESSIALQQKKLDEPKKPIRKTKYVKKTTNELDAIFGYIDGTDATVNTEYEEVSKEVYDDYLEDLAAFEQAEKTYKSVELIKLGWINCDKFLNQSDLVTINLEIDKSKITKARFFAVFEDINSVMSTNYSSHIECGLSFNNVPLGKKIRLVGISSDQDSSLIFDETIVVQKGKPIAIEFVKVNDGDLKEVLANL